MCVFMWELVYLKAGSHLNQADIKLCDFGFWSPGFTSLPKCWVTVVHHQSGCMWCGGSSRGLVHVGKHLTSWAVFLAFRLQCVCLSVRPYAQIGICECMLVCQRLTLSVFLSSPSAFFLWHRVSLNECYSLILSFSLVLSNFNMHNTDSFDYWVMNFITN